MKNRGIRKKGICAILSRIIVFSIVFVIVFSACIDNKEILAQDDVAHDNGGNEYRELANYLEDLICDSNFMCSYSSRKALEIGNEIKVYEVERDNTLIEAEYSLFPIFVNGTIKYTICKGEGVVQISSEFANDINKHKNEHISIVNDKQAVYIFKQETKGIIKILNISEPVDTRGILDVANIPNNVNANMVEPIYDATYKLTHVAIKSDSIIPTITLAAPVVLQKYSNICWAASVASVGNYLTKKSYSAVDVAKGYLGKDFNHSKTLEDSKNALKKMYNISYKHYSYNTPPDEMKIYNNLSAGYPLIGRWKTSSSTHQTVIRGIKHTSGCIYVMDPEQGYVIAYGNGNKFSYYYKSIKVTLIGSLSYK